MSQCVNIPGWTDSFGQGCDFYMNNTIAYCTEDYAKRRLNGGYSGLTACCSCKSHILDPFQGELQIRGGLSTLPRDILVEPSQNVGNCIDLPEWSSPGFNQTGSFTCSDFKGDDLTTNPSMCSLYGNRISKEGVPATKACCVCDGGYNGTLIGRSLRVGLVVDDEDTFMENANRVLNFTAISSGVGMNIAVRFKKFPSCIEALKYEYVDLCFLSGYNFGSLAFNHSKPLGEVNFYFGVPVIQPKEVESYMAMIQPFQYQLWVCLFFFLLFLSLFINIIQKGGCWVKRLSWRNRCASSIYHTFRSCAIGDMSNSSESPRKAEKILSLAFVLFVLIIVTAYTANLAAILSDTRKPRPQFESVDEIVLQLRRGLNNGALKDAVCLSEPLKGKIFDFIRPDDMHLVKFIPQGPSEILIDMSSPEGLYVPSDEVDASSKSVNVTAQMKQCVASVFTAKIYDDIAKENNRLCQKIQMLDTDYWPIEHSIPISTRVVIEPWGMDFLERLNYFIDHNYFIPSPGIETSKQRKGGASRGTSSNEEFSSANECGVDESKLTLDTMRGPFLVFGIMAVCGIFIFMLKRRNRLLARRHIYSRWPTFRGFLLSEEDETYLRREELKMMSPSDLLDQLAKKNVSQRSIDREMSKLPDKKGLEDLMFSVEYRDFVADVMLLSNLPISSLFKIVKDHELVKKKNPSELLDFTDTPQEDLINLIIKNPSALSVGRNEALKLKQTLMIQGGLEDE